MTESKLCIICQYFGFKKEIIVEVLPSFLRQHQHFPPLHFPN